MSALLASNQITGMKRFATVKYVPKLLNTTLTKEAASVQSEIHFYKEEGAYHVHIQIFWIQKLTRVLIAPILIFTVLIAKVVFAQTTCLTIIMASALPAITLTTGMKRQECVSYAQKLMSLISNKENAFVQLSYLMILASNVSAVSSLNIGTKTQKPVNNAH